MPLKTPGEEKVSVVIAGMNRKPLVVRAINSVLESSQAVHQIVYVDGGSTDGTLEELRSNPRYSGSVEILTTEKRHVPAVRNMGARACSGSIILFLDSDAELAPDTIDAASREFRSSDTGIVGVRLLDVEDRRSDVTAGMELGTSLFIPIEGLRTRGRNLDLRRFTFTVCEACMFIRASLFSEMGGFDESLFPYGEEGLDICWRTWREGMSVVYIPKVVYHGSATGRQLIHSDEEARKLTVYLISNGLLVYAKNGDWFSSLFFPLLLLKYAFYCRAPRSWLLPARGLVGFFRRLAEFREKARLGHHTEPLTSRQIMRRIADLNAASSETTGKL